MMFSTVYPEVIKILHGFGIPLRRQLEVVTFGTIQEIDVDMRAFIPKGMKKDKVQNMIAQYHDLSEICGMECDRLQKELDSNKIPNDYETLPKILDAVAFIENNRTELFVREVSMKVYGDSKYFEENTLVQVCQMLRKYKNKPCNTDELMDEILSDYMIKKEPQKFSIKGNFILFIDRKELDFSVFPDGIELD